MSEKVDVLIVGAGFAGLATAYFLVESKSVEVTLFEAKKVGGGASGVCSGLLHPYPGLGARRSFKAFEALALSKQLIRVAEKHTPKMVSTHRGILREALSIEQRELLLQHSAKWGDVEHMGEDLFLIHSGITVLSENYLDGLWNAIEKKGARLLIQKVETLEQLREFDHIVIAAGWGVRKFSECSHLKIKFLKGQALLLKGNPPFERSFISKGYLAHFGSETHFGLGSTYEREFEDDQPNRAVAKVLLAEKLQEAEIIDCKAGVRVANRSHYLPIVEEVAPNVHVFTALGSRGLLYHALFGRNLAQAILFKNNIFT